MAKIRARNSLFLLLTCTMPSLGHAQSVDYAALEQAMGEPVTTSVSGKPQRASEAPADITIITRDDIARSPARDVPGLLATYAGVQVNRWTAGQSDIAVRGGVKTYNARLLVLVNGRQVYLDHYGMTNWNLLGIQLEDIQQIELVRGPVSALYGFNASSGVVNIITVDPMAGAALSAHAEAGSHGLYGLSSSAAVPIGDTVGLRLSAGYDEENERAVPADLLNGAETPTTLTQSVSASLIVQPLPRMRAELSAGHARSRLLEFLPFQILTAQRYRSDTVGLKVDQDTGWGTVSGQAYLNTLRADYGASTGVSAILLCNRIGVSSLSSLVRLDADNTLRMGVEYRDNVLRSPTALFSHRVGYHVVALSGMLDLKPAPAVSLSLAGRVDRLSLFQNGAPALPSTNFASDFDRDFTAISFNAGLVVSLSEDTKLRVNGARGVQSPPLVEFGMRLVASSAFPLPFPLLISGDPNLDPAVTWSADAALTHRIAGLLTVESGIFYNRTTNPISLPADFSLLEFNMIGGPSLAFRSAGVGSYDAAGFSLGGGGRSGAFTWHANYTYTHVREDSSFPSYAFSPRNTTPHHNANLTASYDADRWLVSATVRYTSSSRQIAVLPTHDLGLRRVNAAVGIDARLGWRIAPHTQIYVAGQNLARSDGTAGSIIRADRRVRLGLSYLL